MDCAMNAPGHGNSVVDGINATENCFWSNKWNFLIN